MDTTKPLTGQPLELGLGQPKIHLNQAFSGGAKGVAIGDAGGPLHYVFTTELGLAVNAAYVTKRPLLLRGAPGSGKSSFARAIAESQGWPLLVRVINSDSKLDDLLWRYDYVRRLQHATDPGRTTLHDNGYVEPQALWWALAPESGQRRGTSREDWDKGSYDFPLARSPVAPSSEAVLLLDEIDKADPTLPNDLLVALGEGKFTVRETGDLVVAERSPLIIITTNDERELSRAFIRRCIVAELPQLRGDALYAWFLRVGTAHFPKKVTLITEVARFLVDKSPEPPSVAELVDLLRACDELNIDTKHEHFALMRNLVATKLAPALGG